MHWQNCSVLPMHMFVFGTVVRQWEMALIFIIAGANLTLSNGDLKNSYPISDIPHRYLVILEIC